MNWSAQIHNDDDDDNDNADADVTYKSGKA